MFKPAFIAFFRPKLSASVRVSKPRLSANEPEFDSLSLDLPTSHMALTSHSADEFTHMLKAINGMMLDMLEAN